MNENFINTDQYDKSFYINVLKNNPNDYEAILKLGLIDVKEKQLSSAKEYFKRLIDINEKKYEGHLNLSTIYSFEGDILRANNILEYFLNNIEENLEIINALAINLLNSEKFTDLELHINKYISKHKSHILFYLKGYTLAKADRISESEDFFKKSINLNINFWKNYEFLLIQYEKQSRLNDLKKLIDNAKNIFTENLMLSYYESLYFFRAKDYKQSLSILTNKDIENKFLSQKQEVLKADYLNLLSKVHEKLGYYNEAYSYAIKRNNLIINLKENKKFNKELILNTIKVYKNFFAKKNKTKLNNSCNGIDHSNLVFLIGFPRSGTTLLDTILRSHSQTLLLEEKPYLLDVRHDFYKNYKLADILHIDEIEKINMQKQYFNSFDYNPNKLIIDKYPLNLIELGFIKTLFPKSKIILAIRNPLDCIISCVLTAFKINDGMVNFENITTTSFFYNECFDLLFKYFYYYEINYHEVKYENVVLNFKDEINKLLNFLNLEYEESINNFHKTAMQREKINTPSYDQVVQPIYSSSINRYKNFDEIKKIKPDIKRWISEFSY